MYSNVKNLAVASSKSKTAPKKSAKCDEISENANKSSLGADSTSTPVHSKRTQSVDDLNSNTELTIESIANSNLFASSMVVSSGGSLAEDQQQQTEELTLFSIAKTFTEDNKKAKKQEKEKKEKMHNELEESDTAKKNSSTSAKDEKGAQKRQLSAKPASKNARSSLSKSKNEDDFDDEDEDEDEPKPKKKANRLSSSLNEETSSSARKSSISLKHQLLSEAYAESENDKDTNSLDGTTSGRSTNGANDSLHDVDLDSTEKKSKSGINIKNLEVNDLVRVRYGSLKLIYPAKIMQVDVDSNKIMVHYDGWNKRYDEWIKLGLLYFKINELQEDHMSKILSSSRLI